MCGIAGFVGPGGRDTLSRMTRALQHRDLDGGGLHVDPDMPVFFGHWRLAIIDPLWADRRAGTFDNRPQRGLG